MGLKKNVYKPFFVVCLLEEDETQLVFSCLSCSDADVTAI